MDCRPTDHPAFKLTVHVEHVGVGRMHGGTILMPPKPVVFAIVQYTQSQAAHGTGGGSGTQSRSSWKITPKVGRRVFQKSCLGCMFLRFFWEVWILNGYNLSG